MHAVFIVRALRVFRMGGRDYSEPDLQDSTGTASAPRP